MMSFPKPPVSSLKGVALLTSGNALHCPNMVKIAALKATPLLGMHRIVLKRVGTFHFEKIVYSNRPSHAGFYESISREATLDVDHILRHQRCEVLRFGIILECWCPLNILVPLRKVLDQLVLKGQPAQRFYLLVTVNSPGKGGASWPGC